MALFKTTLSLVFVLPGIVKISGFKPFGTSGCFSAHAQKNLSTIPPVCHQMYRKALLVSLAMISPALYLCSIVIVIFFGFSISICLNLSQYLSLSVLLCFSLSISLSVSNSLSLFGSFLVSFLCDATLQRQSQPYLPRFPDNNFLDTT